MSDSMGTRTPIRFGAALQKIARTAMPSFVPLGDYDSETYLLYLYQKPVIKEWHGYILIQGARRAGRLTAEVAISRRPSVYPVHYGRVRPFLGVDGVRERIGMLHNVDDHWFEYRTQEALESCLKDVVNECVTRGFFALDDFYGKEIRWEIERARKLMGRWLELERESGGRPLGSRFSDLMMESQAHDYIKQSILYDSFGRCLGTLKRRFSDPRWVSAQTFVMSSLMETSSLHELENFFNKIPDVLDDPIFNLVGRMPAYAYVKPPEQFEERVKLYSFFKALSTLEAFFDETVGEVQ